MISISQLYISEASSKISVKDNRVVVTFKDGLMTSLPMETLDGITLLAPAQLSTQCVEQCLIRGIPVCYCSKSGRYFGRMISTGHVHPERQRKQSALYDRPFALELAQRIMEAKIHNQRVVMMRYARSEHEDIEDEEKELFRCSQKVQNARSIQELIGYEGEAAKTYFSVLARCVEPDFAFHGRNRRPPKDPFNSMLSLGYSVLMNELYCAIELKGLNPYFGFVHRDAEKHPTLASDLMEEWRAVLVDSTVMSMINGHEISRDDFYYEADEPGCFISKPAMKSFLQKLETKFQGKMKYLSYTDDSISFRRAINLQISCLTSAIMNEDASQYHPIRIR